MNAQPVGPQDVPTGMSPLEIAKSRLTDLAQGAHPDMFDQASAVRIWHYLAELKDAHTRLTELVDQLPPVLSRVSIHGPTPAIVAVGQLLGAIAEERNR